MHSLPDITNKSLISTRRGLLAGAGAIGLGAALTACSDDAQGQGGQGASESGSPSADPGTGARPTTAEEAWSRLAEGNARWAADESIHPNTDLELRESLVDTQEPWAIIFGCVDSRVAPELVFDTGTGELMTVRTAGSTYDELIAESVAYGPVAIGTPLVVVLGHQHCGAVTHAFHALSDGTVEEDPFDEIDRVIEPAYDSVEQSGDEEADVDAMIRANVLLTVEALKELPEFAEPIANGLEIVGAYYSLETGEVERL